MTDLMFYRLISLYYARNHYRGLAARNNEDWDESLAGYMLKNIEKAIEVELEKIDLPDLLELL